MKSILGKQETPVTNTVASSFGRYRFSDLVNVEKIRQLFEKFTALHHVSVTLVEREANQWLFTCGKRDLCERYFWSKEKSANSCHAFLESLIERTVHEQTPQSGQCESGLTYAALPLMINHECVAIMLAGQIFLAASDRELFIQKSSIKKEERQALEAELEAVPVFSEHHFQSTIEYLSQVVELISHEGMIKMQVEESKRALTRSDKRYRTYFDNSPDAVIVTDDRGAFLEVNPHAVALTEYCVAELLELSLLDFVPEQGEAVLELLGIIREHGKATMELEFSFNHGRLVFVEIDAAALSEDEYIVFIKDISDRKRAEQEEQRRYESFLMAFTDNPSPMILVDSERWTISDFNQQFQKVSGLNKTTLSGIELRSCSLFKDGAWEPLIKKINSDQTLDQTPVQLCTLSGDAMEMLVSARNVELLGRNFCVIVFFDITQRVKAEKALQESRERLCAIADNVNGMVAQYVYYPDKPPQFLFVSQGCKKLYGIDAQELLEHPEKLIERYHPDDLNLINRTQLEAYMSRSHWELDFRIVHQGGIISWIHATASPQRLSTGKIAWAAYHSEITDKKIALEKLKKSEEKLGFYFKHNPMAYIEFNASLDIVDWNRSAAELYGYERETILGKNALDVIIPEEARMEVQGLYELLVRHSGGESALLANKTRWGDELICQWHNTPIMDSDGKLKGIASLIHDVTRQKKAEKSLIESEQRFREVSELASDWFWETDANNLFTFITQRYFDLTETESDKVIGQSFDMLLKRVHPEDVKFFKEIHSKIRKRQNFRNVEFRLQLSNGQVSWFHICGRPFFDSEGVYVGYRGTGSDVTLQKSTELALKLSEQRFRDIAESASDWFWETDDQLNLVSISPGFCQRFAVTENALRGSSFFRLFHPHNDKGFDPELLLQLGLVEKRTFRDFEYSVPALDGSPIWLSFSGKAAFGVHKEYLGYRGAVKDISARKRIEEALKMHQHELERLVDEQTWEIRAAKEAADLSNQAKTDFLENLSDSLRSPVHAILAFTELYLEKKERPSDEKIYSYIQHIHDSGRKLLPLLNDLSDISRLELGSMDFHPQAYSIEKLAREAADELLAYSKGIENILLTVDSPKWDTTVECDPDRIKQVFHNLLSNAVKFSDGAIKISISFSKDKLSHYGLNGSKRMPAVTVNVQDCGVGIPESELDSIFDLFVMSSRTRKGFSGAGLGLPICREIIEAHHGKISAKNGTSCGVVMSFSLPVKHVSDA